MREIKFRGKPTSNIVNWLYGDLIQKSDGTMQILSIGDYPTKGIRVNPETLGQYTGIKDRNGKEIYEGDIIEIYHVNCNTFETGQVEFIDGGFKMNGYNLDTLTLIAVIDNVYDNIELLEGKK